MARSTRRLLLAVPVLGVALLAPSAASAQAVDPACTFNAGQGNNMTLVCQTNDRAVQRLFVVFQSGTTVTAVTPSDPAVTCDNMTGTPPHIVCNSAPPAPAGSTIQIGLTTQDLYVGGEEDSAAGCSPDCTQPEHNFGPNHVSGPDRSQPPAECTNWDWQVTVDPFNFNGIDSAGVVQFHLDNKLGKTASWDVTVRNLGPCRSPATRLNVVADSGGRVLDVNALLARGDRYVQCPPRPPGARPCDLEGLDPGEQRKWQARVRTEGRFSGRAGAFVDCDVVGESNQCENNAAEFPFIQFSRKNPGTDEALPNGIAHQPARRVRRIRGTVQKALGTPKASVAGKPRSKRKVQIALVRLPAAVGEKCRWLRNKRGKFRSNDPVVGHCADPVWLKAKGTRRWVYRLRKTLPKGNYVLYARAFDSKGRPQVDFDDENKEEFTLT